MVPLRIPTRMPPTTASMQSEQVPRAMRRMYWSGDHAPRGVVRAVERAGADGPIVVRCAESIAFAEAAVKTYRRRGLESMARRVDCKTVSTARQLRRLGRPPIVPANAEGTPVRH